LRKRCAGLTIAAMEATVALNRGALRQYIDRVGDRWRLDGAYIGGSALNGERSSDHESDALGRISADQPLGFTVVLVSDGFGQFPWLERIHVAGSLWDALEMGAPADVHCYTHAEFVRKRESSAWLRDTIWHGLDLLALI
jgi:hypothetical protein